MKTQLIMLPQPILVSNEEIKENDWYYSSQGVLQSTKSYFEDKRGLRTYYLTHELWSFLCQKIIAGIPKLPAIDFSALSEKECKVIGWIDLEKLARDAVSASNSVDVKLVREVWKNGFETAQSLNEKKFTLSDLKSAFSHYAFTSTSQQPYSDKELDEAFDKFVSALSRPKVFDVEIETEWYKDLPPGGGFGGAAPIDLERPQITNNSIKVLRLL